MWGDTLTKAQRAAMGVGDNLVRISVGLKDERDLIDDFSQALNQASAKVSDVHRSTYGVSCCTGTKIKREHDTKRMNVFIIGSGAIGKTLAVFLKLSGRNVVLLRGSVDDKSNYTEKIQVVLNNQSVLEAEIDISTLSNFAELEGVIVLANKSYGNENLSRALTGKGKNSPVVILQNGLGVEQAFVDGNFSEIYRCVLFTTTQIIGPNKLRFKPVSISPIGTIRGDDSTLKVIVEHLDNPHFRFQEETDIQPIIWKKAIINCVFNSICPLLEVDNGIFHRDEQVLEIAKRVVEECVEIAQTKGIDLSVDQVVESVLLISRSSDGQLISTLVDINNKRETEIETLNFAIVDAARILDKENAVKETKLLGELTRFKSYLNGST
jgi:2-dehydropantoate 2-reductase